MEIHLGMELQIETPLGKLDLELMVEPRSSHLNPQTGKVMENETLNKALQDALSHEVKQFAYLPQTMEVYASRLFEQIEEELGYEARVSRLKLYNPTTHLFVVYDGRPDNRRARRKTEEQSA